MKRKYLFPLLTALSVVILLFVASRWIVYADSPQYGRGWTPVYLNFPEDKLYVECIETGDPHDFCIPTGYHGTILE